jgi:hypothetical protein
VDYKLVEQVYRSYWKFIKETISEQPYLENVTEEEFNSITTNFNIPYIGKLYTSYNKIQKYNKKLNYYKDVRNKKD